MSAHPDPNSRIRRVVALMREKGEMSPNDFVRLVGNFCETESQQRNLIADLTRNGLVERRVVLTEKGMR